LINNLTNEHDKLSILGSLYDSTTIDTEENQKFPITIVESIVTNKNNLIYNSLSEDSRYDLYGYYISKNYYYSQLYDKSLTAVEEALKIYPNKTNGLGIKGSILYIMERYQESLQCYDEIITKLDPKYVLAWLNKGNTLDRIGRNEEAIHCYDQIITKLDPKHIDALNNKGVALDRLGQKEEAIACYDKALKIEPNNIQIMNNKGYVLINLGKYEQAVEYFNKVLSIDPDYINALENRKIAEEKLRLQ
jgi:tetratricopeptide (TPR) repeat protein